MQNSDNFYTVGFVIEKNHMRLHQVSFQVFTKATVISAQTFLPVQFFKGFKEKVVIFVGLRFAEGFKCVIVNFFQVVNCFGLESIHFVVVI